MPWRPGDHVRAPRDKARPSQLRPGIIASLDGDEPGHIRVRFQGAREAVSVPSFRCKLLKASVERAVERASANHDDVVVVVEHDVDVAAANRSGRFDEVLGSEQLAPGLVDGSRVDFFDGRKEERARVVGTPDEVAVAEGVHPWAPFNGENVAGDSDAPGRFCVGQRNPGFTRSPGDGEENVRGTEERSSFGVWHHEPSRVPTAAWVAHGSTSFVEQPGRNQGEAEREFVGEGGVQNEIIEEGGEMVPPENVGSFHQEPPARVAVNAEGVVFAPVGDAQEGVFVPESDAQGRVFAPEGVASDGHPREHVPDSPTAPSSPVAVEEENANGGALPAGIVRGLAAQSAPGGVGEENANGDALPTGIVRGLAAQGSPAAAEEENANGDALPTGIVRGLAFGETASDAHDVVFVPESPTAPDSPAFGAEVKGDVLPSGVVSGLNSVRVASHRFGLDDMYRAQLSGKDPCADAAPVELENARPSHEFEEVPDIDANEAASRHIEMVAPPSATVVPGPTFADYGAGEPGTPEPPEHFEASFAEAHGVRVTSSGGAEHAVVVDADGVECIPVSHVDESDDQVPVPGGHARPGLSTCDVLNPASNLPRGIVCPPLRSARIPSSPNPDMLPTREPVPGRLQLGDPFTFESDCFRIPRLANVPRRDRPKPRRKKVRSRARVPPRREAPSPSTSPPLMSGPSAPSSPRAPAKRKRSVDELTNDVSEEIVEEYTFRKPGVTCRDAGSANHENGGDTVKARDCSAKSKSEDVSPCGSSSDGDGRSAGVGGRNQKPVRKRQGGPHRAKVPVRASLAHQMRPVKRPRNTERKYTMEEVEDAICSALEAADVICREPRDVNGQQDEDTVAVATGKLVGKQKERSGVGLPKIRAGETSRLTSVANEHAKGLKEARGQSKGPGVPLQRIPPGARGTPGRTAFDLAAASPVFAEGEAFRSSSLDLLLAASAKEAKTPLNGHGPGQGATQQGAKQGSTKTQTKASRKAKPKKMGAPEIAYHVPSVGCHGEGDGQSVFSLQDGSDDDIPLAQMASKVNRTSKPGAKARKSSMEAPKGTAPVARGKATVRNGTAKNAVELRRAVDIPHSSRHTSGGDLNTPSEPAKTGAVGSRPDPRKLGQNGSGKAAFPPRSEQLRRFEKLKQAALTPLTTEESISMRPVPLTSALGANQQRNSSKPEAGRGGMQTSRRKPSRQRRSRDKGVPRKLVVPGQGGDSELRSESVLESSLPASELRNRMLACLKAPKFVAATETDSPDNVAFRLWGCSCGATVETGFGDVQCSSCYTWTHGICSGLSAEDYASLTASNRKSEGGNCAFVCFLCSEASVDLNFDRIVRGVPCCGRTPLDTLFATVALRRHQDSAASSTFVAPQEILEVLEIRKLHVSAVRARRCASYPRALMRPQPLTASQINEKADAVEATRQGALTSDAIVRLGRRLVDVFAGGQVEVEQAQRTKYPALPKTDCDEEEEDGADCVIDVSRLYPRSGGRGF